MDVQRFKICPECGEHNPPNLFECRNCEADLTGVKVVDGSAAEPETAAPAVSPPGEGASELVRICECGVVNAPQARKCKACGEDISDIIPTRAEKEKEEEKRFCYELTSPCDGFSAIFDKPLVLLGRDAELQEYLAPKIYVSRKHAKLITVSDKVFVENVSRTNKTFLNNEEIPDNTPASLKDGDEIGLGGKVIDGSRQEYAAYFIFRIKR